jgi:hypothetical protein
MGTTQALASVATPANDRRGTVRIKKVIDVLTKIPRSQRPAVEGFIMTRLRSREVA